MIAGLFESSWGGVRVWASNIRTVNSRRIVLHDPSSGDEHPIDDQGLEARVTTCTLLFDEMEGATEEPMERFDRFRAMVEAGDERIFAHPLVGSYLAKVGRFEHEVDEDSNLTAEVEFIPVSKPPPVVLLDAGLSAPAGVDGVGAAADVADAELEAVGLSTDVTASARDAVETWDDPDSGTIRRILVDVARLTNQIDTAVDDLELATSLDHWPAWKALLLLRDSIVAAGRAATADVSRLITVRIGRPIALRTLLAGIYGARDVDYYYTKARSLNDIRQPAWIETGTELKLPQPGQQPRRG